MPRATDLRVCDARTSTRRIAYRTPIKFGGRVVNDCLLLDVEITVETRAGRRGVGYGSMPLGNAWAWPSRTVEGDAALNAMRLLGERAPQAVIADNVSGHPLQLSRAWAPVFRSLAASIAAEFGPAEPMPILAQLVALSPLEAAIHDAFGRVHHANAYDLLGPDWIDEDLAGFLGDDFAGEYLDRYTLRTPKPQMPLYHLVGALDPLTTDDVITPVGDGLPETLAAWIQADDLTHLKIKLAGDDLEWDVARVVAVDRVARAAREPMSPAAWRYSLDFNEKCRDVEYVLEFLARVREQSPAAFERVHYIEQPTHRDLQAFPENVMHRAAAVKPVVIDESLIGLESLLQARAMGYSGVALKACKGHSEPLLMGAAAQKFGLFLCVQDLTCPGFSFLHSASLAARIPTVAAIEGNSRQYCPAGNEAWRERYPGMFQIRGGVVRTEELNGVGLGFSPLGE